MDSSPSTAEISVDLYPGDLSADAPTTPSRGELLKMAKKHSFLLDKSAIDEQDASDVGMDAKFWHEILDLYFFRGRISKGREEDDLVFFVRRSKSFHGYGFNDGLDDTPPFFVRRWDPSLEKVIGENHVEVDWERSFYLNVIVHTTFSVTVAICRDQDLRRHQHRSNASLSPVYKVLKTVYASPSRVTFHLDHRKSAETQPAYPNICFSVDDFDDMFDAVVLSEVDHCYCVVLNAHSGAAFPTDAKLDDNNSNPLLVGDKLSADKTPPKCTLFSGFVGYRMVREAYHAGRSSFGSILRGHNHTKTDRLFMRGPEGRGEVEVAVSGIADQSHVKSNSALPFESSKKDSTGGIGSMLQRAASAASEFAKHAYAATSNDKRLDTELLPLKCCLMSISLPWEYIAHDLLFKETPVLNI